MEPNITIGGDKYHLRSSFELQDSKKCNKADVLKEPQKFAKELATLLAIDGQQVVVKIESAASAEKDETKNQEGGS